uniref:Transposase Tc1-like domain-containing protein n=1 Tax=Pygocentrus nattereri TaxID=42514 RepID=A0AAR2JMY3_PYGNA
MVRKELPEHQRDLIIQTYQSGEGYKRISKSLNIPWNTVKTVIIKWRKHGTTVTLPRTGRPSKIDDKTRRKLVREAAKRPTATLKELQEFLASTSCAVHVTTISHLLHMSGLWGRVARRKPYLSKKNIQAQLNFAKRHLKSHKCMCTVVAASCFGLFFFSWNWGLSQGGRNYEQFQIPVSVGTKPLAFC